MKGLIGKKIHQVTVFDWYYTIVEIVSYTEKLLLVKTRAEDGFEHYECFEKKNGEWDFTSYWYHSDRKTALFLFELDCKQKSA